MKASLPALFLILFLGPQDPKGEIQKLIDRLGAERIEERQETSSRLRQVGRRALPELRKAARNDNDPEIAKQARFLVHLIGIEAEFTPRFRALLPRAADRLARGDDHVWTEVFLEAAWERGGIRPYPSLVSEDLEPLAASALKGVRTTDEIRQVCQLVGRRRLRSAIPELIRRLESEDSSNFSNIIYALTRLRAKEAVPSLRKLVTSPWRNRGIAARALGILRAEEALGGIVALLEASDSKLHIAALEALGRMGQEKAAPHLLKLLRSNNPVMRRSGLRTVASLKVTDLTENVRALLDDPESKVRLGARVTLIRLKGENVAQEIAPLFTNPSLRYTALSLVKKYKCKELSRELMEVLKDPDPQLQRRAIEVLVELGIKPAVPRLIELLKDPDRSVRQEAIRGLAVLGGEKATKTLLDLLDIDNVEVRQSTLAVLRPVHAELAGPKVADLLKHDDRLVRGAAARAIGVMRAQDYSSNLIAQMKDSDISVRSASLVALRRLEIEVGITQIVELLIDMSVQVREEAVRTLGRLAGQSAIPQITSLLSDEDADVRRAVFETLAELDARNSAPRILEVIQKSNDPVDQISGLRALSVLGNSAMGVQVISFFKAENRDVRRAAQEALSHLGDRSHITSLKPLLEADSGGTRSAALTALAKLQAREVIPEIRSRLSDPEHDVRLAAAQALCILGDMDGIPVLLEESQTLTFLIPLRYSEMWARLRKMPLKDELTGTRIALLRQVVKRAGINVVAPRPATSLGRIWINDHVRLSKEKGHISLWDCLTYLLQGPFEAVLEEDTLRLLPFEEGWDYWSAWWKTTKGRNNE